MENKNTFISLYTSYKLRTMTKIKDIAEVQTGTYLKSSPNPDTIYFQANDFDSEGDIQTTTKPSVSTTDKNRSHFLASNNLLFMAKGYNNFCTIFKEHNVKCVASSSFLVIRIKENRVLPEYLNWYLNLPDRKSVV